MRRVWEDAAAQSALAPIVLIALGASAFPAPTEAADLAAFERRSHANEACFARKLDRYIRENPDKGVRAGGGAGIFVAEQIANQISVDPGSGNLSGPFVELPVEEFCERHLWRPYLETLQRAEADEREEMKGTLAPLGSVSIESRSAFVQSYQNLIGLHFRGHADITRAALERFTGPRAFSEHPSLLVQRASQAPDLFRWNDERYHAHTPEYDPADAADRASKIETGKKRYQALMISLYREFKRYADGGSEERALVVLGLIAHMVQDLVYHRGMTLAQHAGLAYTLKQNPDLPEGPLAQSRFDEAAEQTQRALSEALRMINEASRKRLLAWRVPDGFDFPRLAGEIFGSREDIGVAPLIKYWMLSLPYTTGERSTEELHDSPCGAPRGRACWMVGDILSPIFPATQWLAQREH